MSSVADLEAGSVVGLKADSVVGLKAGSVVGLKAGIVHVGASCLGSKNWVCHLLSNHLTLSCF